VSDIWTPYSTLGPFMTDKPAWVDEMHQERLASYSIYDQIYWNFKEALQVSLRGTNTQPLLIPSARTIVDETSHYLLKGLTIETDDPESEFGLWMDAFLKREMFDVRMHEGKHSGVIKGDWLYHITADPEKPEGSRVSLTTLDPGSYFPYYDDDDPDKLLAVDLVNQIEMEGGKVRVHKLRYSYPHDDDGNLLLVGGVRRVLREEGIYEMEGWWDGKAARIHQVLLKEELLTDSINTIPVYHFKNIRSQGDPFGSSEIRGFEALIGGINQTSSDEEIVLALDGIGVWVTDASKPDGGWSVGPGEVMEIGQGQSFKRAEGVRSVEPMLNHIQMVQEALYKGSHTFDAQGIDVQIAESGVALAIKFMPTLAKIELRDKDGLARLEQLFFDIRGWFADYEGQDFREEELAIVLGQKLPTVRKETLNELNNMLDRKVISRKYYREEMARHMGYSFPDGIEDDIIAEEKALAEARQFMSPENGQGFDNPNGDGNRSNNRGRPNESAGTEADDEPKS
jgi:hypothetical protein